MKINYKSELEKAQKEIIDLEKKLERAKILINKILKDLDSGVQS